MHASRQTPATARSSGPSAVAGEKTRSSSSSSREIISPTAKPARSVRVRSVSSIESPRAYLWGGEDAVVSTGMQPLCSIESPRAYPPFTPVFRASSRAIWSGGTWSELSSGYAALALAPPPTTSVQQSVSTAATSSRAPPDALR